jgi:cytochrome P450
MHLAFGRGIHYCIGNQLARAEVRIAIERILKRLPTMRLDPSKPRSQYAEVFHTHALASLDVVF